MAKMRSKRKTYKKYNKKRSHKKRSHKKRNYKKKSNKRHYRRRRKNKTRRMICKCCVKRKCPCVTKKLRGGGGRFITDMGERFTGYAYNNHETDLRSTSTQNHHPIVGGGLSQALIDFGGSGLVTAGRNLVNMGQNAIRQYNGDKFVASADPVVPGNNSRYTE